MSGRPKSARSCVFCSASGCLSKDHVIPRRVGKALGVRAVSQERNGKTRALLALGVVLPLRREPVSRLSRQSIVICRCCARPPADWARLLKAHVKRVVPL
jgi:hypothetical protein